MKSHLVEGKCAETEVPGTKLGQNVTGASERESKWPLKTHPFQKFCKRRWQLPTNPIESQTRFRKGSTERATSPQVTEMEGVTGHPHPLPQTGKDRGGSMWTWGKEPQQLWHFYRVSALGVTQWDTQESAPIQLSQPSSHSWMYMGQWQGDRDIQGNLPCFCSLALGPAASVIMGQIGRRKNKSHRWSWWHSTRWFNI